ncbi:saccharopine dehydrogenase-like oxidoreductase [Chironomus tepperi]|uniref:saccharopine dehydrogenase-like oxidoreductase n=1 Tax=Chironomus tepperi TaxID=113505 RepID=UPI00391F4CB4
MAGRLDVVIFGASGYTGKYAIISSINLLKGFKWAVAGRNKEKLQATLKEVEAKTNQDLSKIPIIIADVNDEKSLKEMTVQAKVVVNCCGPYRFFGEQVVKACVETSTSHVDVSGEPQYMETMQLKYNDAAREKGIYIVSACGFDSIPADMGIVYLQDKFKGTLNSVETFITWGYTDGYKPSGASIHYGTYESAVYGFAHANELGGIRRQLFKEKLPRFKPTLKSRGFAHKQPIIGNKWCIPFMGSDRSVVSRSQRYFFEEEKNRPVQMHAYISFGSFFALSTTLLLGFVFGVLARSEFGRKLLLNYPKIFTFGAVSHEGPSEEKNENSILTMYFLGLGWKEKLSESTDQFDIPMNKKITTKVTIKNPGYGATCDALVLCARNILKERNNMPQNGGVYAPAAAFRHTSLLKDLQNNGYAFEVIKTEERK